MISVIIPIYNAAAKGLEECLQRVANQTYSDIQVCMVDDGSEDDSGAICDSWTGKDPRFVVVHQRNLGPASARNKGLQMAKGSEVVFVDSDDLPASDMLESLYAAMTNKGADMALARYNDFGDSRCNEEICLTGEWLQEGIFDYYTPLYKNIYAKIFSRELLDGLWFNDLRTGEDIDFLMRVYKRVGCCAYADRVVYEYQVHADSIMHTQTAKDYLDILTCYENLLPQIDEDKWALRGKALDALMRKVVSSRYRNRVFHDEVLSARIEYLIEKYLPLYKACDNGNRIVKLGLLTCLKMPWLHACLMRLRER